MSQRVLIAVFREEMDLRRAVREVRRRGAQIIDVFCPYAVHGLDADLGWRPSRLTWACGVCGAVGALLMLTYQFWTNSIDWPVNVGGKPLNSLPAFVPVTFEAMVLLGAIGTVLAFFVISRLWPGKPARLVRPHVTDDRFALVIQQTDATFDATNMTALLDLCGGEEIEERAIGSVSRSAADDVGNHPALRWVNATLAVVFALLVVAVLVGPQRGNRPNYEFLPTMRRSLPLDPQAKMTGVPAAQALPGVIARGTTPLNYGPGEQEAKRAAEELTNPFTADGAAALERGREVYFNFCASCHGPSGEGDGPIAARGYPPPPPLGAPKSRLLKDGELFHVISFGRNNMPPHRHQIVQHDRWKALLYIRELQRRAAQKEAEAAQATGGDGASSPDARDGTNEQTTDGPVVETPATRSVKD